MDLGEGLASAGKSIGEGMQKSAKRKKNEKLAATIFGNLGDSLKPEATGELKTLSTDLDYDEDILPQIATRMTLMKAIKEQGATKLTNYTEDPATGELTKLDKPVKVPKESPMPEWKPEKTYAEDSPQKMAVGMNLMGKFNDQVKDFFIIRRNYVNMDKALEHALAAGDTKSKSAADQALVISFNKMLDPQSVVRESEYARTPQGQSALATLQGYVEKVQQGGVGLTDANRQDVVDVAKQLYSGAEDFYNLQRTNYTDMAKNYGLDPAMVVGNDLSVPKEDNVLIEKARSMTPAQRDSRLQQLRDKAARSK
jgi:hypothetical protein